MFQILALTQGNEYFIPLSERQHKGVFFCRFIGYEKETSFFESFDRFLEIASQKGLVIRHGIANPSEAQIKKFYELIGDGFVLELKKIKLDVRLWMGSFKQETVDNVSQAIYTMLLYMKNNGANENIIKNAFVKFMCWIRGGFGQVLKYSAQEQLPKILYEGDITKYEIYMLYIAALAGCDVAYVHPSSDASYLKADKKSEFSTLVTRAKKQETVTAMPQKKERTIQSYEQKLPQLNEMLKASEGIVVTNEWMESEFWDVLHVSNSARFLSSKPQLFNMFIRYIGVDQAQEYNNRLFKFKKEIYNSQKKASMLLLNHIPNADNKEIQAFRDITFLSSQELIFKLCETIDIAKDKVRTTLAQKAFLEVAKCRRSYALPKLYNHCVRLLCWLNRFASALYKSVDIENPPLIAFYGKITEYEAELLYLFSQMGADIIYISPDKEDDRVFQKQQSLFACSKKIELQNSVAQLEFPQRECKIKAATTAYKASRELDSLLYQGSGMYRPRQFVRSKPVTLKTTYDEINILWKQDAVYRNYFEEKDDCVTVPNIFAKICGVERNDRQKYWDTIRGMLTKDTILITSIPYHEDKVTSVFGNTAGFLDKQDTMQFDIIKKNPSYRYEYLNDNTQDFMLEKIQEMLRLDWVIAHSSKKKSMILDTLLTLDKQLLQLIQKFDFTGSIPKVVVVDVNEALFSLKDCIYLLFVNLIGFDIVVFTPTGYKNIEKYLKKEAFEEHIIGDFEFDMTVPHLEIQTNDRPVSGIFCRLFGKGK